MFLRDGRPESYIGAVGRFRLSAKLSPQQVKTGDPMTLVLALSGEGALESAKAPDLSKNPAIAKNFKIYDATEQTKDGVRRFTYSLRPLTAEIKEFPPIEASYFDVQTERFDTLRTDPIPLEITAADKLAGRDIVSSPLMPPGNGKELETREKASMRMSPISRSFPTSRFSPLLGRRVGGRCSPGTAYSPWLFRT